MKLAILLANERIRQRRSARQSLSVLREVAKRESANLSLVDHSYLDLAMAVFSRGDRGGKEERWNWAAKRS